MEAMTEREQQWHAERIATVRHVTSALRLTKLAAEAEDVAVALARLENWLTENDGRWVK